MSAPVNRIVLDNGKTLSTDFLGLVSSIYEAFKSEPDFQKREILLRKLQQELYDIDDEFRILKNKVHLEIQRTKAYNAEINKQQSNNTSNGE